MTRMAKRRKWHIVCVMAWGYTMPQAFALCKQNNWWGDKYAQGDTA